MSQTPSSKSPSLMRYARVQAVLEQEPAFASRMGDKTEAVCKPTGEKQLFSIQAIQVTQAIHSAGKDAHKVHKTEIIKFALPVFKIGQKPAPAPQPVNGAAVEPPVPPVLAAPAEPTPAAPKPAKAAAAKPLKAAGKPKVAPVAAATPEPPKVEEPTKPAAPTAEVENREADLKKAREILTPERPGENQAAFNAYISMYSMSLTLIQLVELYDNQPGKDKRFKALDELAKEFNKFTSIKSAKEAQKAQS